MSEDLELLMRKARGQAPAPEFVAKLRERITAETAPPVLIDDGDETVVELHLAREPEQRATVPPWLVAAAVAVIAIAGTLIASATPTLVTTTTQEPPSFVADANLVTDEFSYLDKGRYLFDTVGTPFTLKFDQEQYVAVNSQGRITITHLNSQGDGDRVIAFTRLSALSDPEQPTEAPESFGESWPADDFSGWLDYVSDQILITDRQETSLGGLRATRVDLELGSTDCRQGVGSCMFLGTNRSLHSSELLPGSRYRVWVVEQGDEEPLTVVVAVDRESDLDWFKTADTILETLAFGEVGPNPILETSVDSTELPFLGGVRLEPQAEIVALQDPGGFGRVIHSDWNAATEFLANPLDLDGNVLTTIGDVTATLRAADAELVELEATSIAGLNARVFEISAESLVPTLKVTTESERAWRVPLRGRMWLIEHPDRGLLMVTANVFENVDIVFPLVVAQSEEIVESLEFVELG